MKRVAFKRAAIVTGAVSCLVLAALLVLFAADVSRWRDALQRDDVRYRAAPSDDDLWNPAAFVPLGATQKMLGVDDDVAFRRAVRALRLSKLDQARTSDPRLVLQRADAQARLEAIVSAGGDPKRRSKAMTLLGVLQLAMPSATAEERAAVLKAGIANLQEAITLDPDNDDAKYNLEVAIRRSRGVQTVQGGPAPNPATGPGSSKGAATGPPGRGY
jgi:hypothetical protein